MRVNGTLKTVQTTRMAANPATLSAPRSESGERPRCSLTSVGVAVSAATGLARSASPRVTEPLFVALAAGHTTGFALAFVVASIGTGRVAALVVAAAGLFLVANGAVWWLLRAAADLSERATPR